MKRIIPFAVILAILGGLVWFTGGGNNTHKDKSAAMPPPASNTPPTPALQQNPHTPTTRLPTIESVHLDVQDAGGHELAHMDLVPNKFAPVPGTDLQVRFTEFYTHWNWDQRAQNLSFEEQNPAVKVEIWRGEKKLYDAWAFKNIPYFRMSHHAGGALDEAEDKLAFTLINYVGLKTG